MAITRIPKDSFFVGEIPWSIVNSVNSSISNPTPKKDHGAVELLGLGLVDRRGGVWGKYGDFCGILVILYGISWWFCMGFHGDFFHGISWGFCMGFNGDFFYGISWWFCLGFNGDFFMGFSWGELFHEKRMVISTRMEISSIQWASWWFCYELIWYFYGISMGFTNIYDIGVCLKVGIFLSTQKIFILARTMINQLMEQGTIFSEPHSIYCKTKHFMIL